MNDIILIMTLFIYRTMNKNPESTAESPQEGSSDDLAKLEQIAKTVKFMNRYALLMDTFGAEVIAGLLPVVGDAASSITSMTLEIKMAKKVDMPAWDQLLIALDHAVDLGIGSVPIIGDLADYLYQSNVHARDRFRKHFENELQKAKRDGMITNADERRLQKIAGSDAKLSSKPDNRIINAEVVEKPPVVNPPDAAAESPSDMPAQSL
jgi:hypothetical protein